MEKKFTAKNTWLGAVNPKHCDLMLLTHCFVTGLIDASTFDNWNVFVGMQTGNTVILALSSASLPSDARWSWLTTLVSILSFLAGAFVTSRLSSLFVPLRRLTITANLLCQGLLILISAALVTAPTPYIPLDNSTQHSDRTLADIRIVSVIPLLAFQSGAQITTSKLLGFDEIPINVLTSTYAGLMSDTSLFKKDNVKRNRRLAAIVLLLGGAFCAAWILKRGPGIMLCLWIGAALKILAALCVGIFALPADQGLS